MTETLFSNRPNPCKGCGDRYPACSGHCQKPEYIAHKAEQEKIRKARRAYQSSIWTHEETNPANYRKHQKRR